MDFLRAGAFDLTGMPQRGALTHWHADHDIGMVCSLDCGIAYRTCCWVGCVHLSYRDPIDLNGLRAWPLLFILLFRYLSFLFRVFPGLSQLQDRSDESGWGMQHGRVTRDEASLWPGSRRKEWLSKDTPTLLAGSGEQGRREEEGGG